MQTFILGLAVMMAADKHAVGHARVVAPAPAPKHQRRSTSAEAPATGSGTVAAPTGTRIPCQMLFGCHPFLFSDAALGCFPSSFS